MEDVPLLSIEDYELLVIVYNNITSCNISMLKKEQMDTIYNISNTGSICSMDQFKVGRADHQTPKDKSMALELKPLVLRHH